MHRRPCSSRSVSPLGADRAQLLAIWLSASAVGCSVDVHAILPGPDVADEADTSLDESETSEPDADAGPDTGSDALLDLGDGDSFSQHACGLLDDESLDAPLACDRPTPSRMIDPVVAWTWTGRVGEDSVIVTPLVANLDDDDSSGTIDLCDRPDVLVVAVGLGVEKDAPVPAGHIYVLAGSDGAELRRFAHPVHAAVTPAIADLDADGEPEIVTLEAQSEAPLNQLVPHRLVAFEHDGSVRWLGPYGPPQRAGGAVAIADLDADGSPEILAPGFVSTASGTTLWQPTTSGFDTTPLAVDLDLDGQLEVLIGGNAYTAQGAPLFDTPGVPLNRGTAAVANFDDDPWPEIYVQHNNHRILEHDGSVKSNCPGGGAGFPVAIADLDDDGRAEILHAHANSVRVLAVNDDDQCKVQWSRKVDEIDARSSGTAFDLLGDGELEVIYADRSAFHIFDSQGLPLFDLPRVARTSIAYPIVADVDNDAAADIVFGSSQPVAGDPSASLQRTASVVVLRNVDDGFAPTRRIWNQHTYHSTNIAEDASVPVSEPPHWLDEQGFRTNGTPTSVNAAQCQGVPALP